MEENEDNLQYRLEATIELTAEVKAAIEKIDANISELINRSGFILAVSGLLAIAAVGLNDRTFLLYFLKWILPHLILSLALVFPALFLRKYINVWDFPAVRGDRRAQLERQQFVLDRLNDIYSKYRQNFKFVNRLLGLSLMFALLFVVSFTVNFYLFTFGQLFSTNESVIFTVLIWFFGGVAYSYIYFIKPKAVSTTGHFKGSVSSHVSK